VTLQNRPLIGSELSHFQLWNVNFYGYSPNPFSFSSESVNAFTNTIPSPFQQPLSYIF